MISFLPFPLVRQHDLVVGMAAYLTQKGTEHSLEKLCSPTNMDIYKQAFLSCNKVFLFVNIQRNDFVMVIE